MINTLYLEKEIDAKLKLKYEATLMRKDTLHFGQKDMNEKNH